MEEEPKHPPQGINPLTQQAGDEPLAGGVADQMPAGVFRCRRESG